MNDIFSLLPKFENLEKLILSADEGSVEIPDDDSLRGNLKELTICGTDIEEFPAEIGQLSKLKSFSMEYANCDINDIIATLANLPDLRELHLTPYCYDCWAEFDLPDSIAQLTKLEILDLAGTLSLRSLPSSIACLKNLRELDLCNYDHELGNEAVLEGLPESIGELLKLEKFDIFGCEKVSELPESFQHLTSLRHLDLCNTGIKQIILPEDQLSSLEYLWMQGDLPDLSKAKHLKNFAWKKLNGKNCSGDSSEAQLARMLPSAPSIERLQLMGCDFEDIDFIFDMPKVKYVYLFGRLRRMPDRKKLLERRIRVMTCKQ